MNKTDTDSSGNWGCTMICLGICAVIIMYMYFGYQLKVIDHQSQVCVTTQAQ